MKTPFRYVTALAAALLVVSSVPGCSKPIDPNSSVPAALQPLVLVIAAVGIGVGVAALDHRNQSHSGGTPAPAIATPTFVGSVGNQPLDLAVDPSVSGSVGVLGQNNGSGNYGFTELGSSPTNAGSYGLPAGYRPTAVAIDALGNDWFDDGSGNVDECAPPTSTPRTCTPALTFNDGLGNGGTRALAADSTHFFIAADNRRGSVNWAAYLLDGTNRISGSYAYGGGGLYAQDAAAVISGAAVATYALFHQDGTSWTLALPGPATKNNFTFNPVPLAAGNVAFDGSSLFYGLLGSAAAGSYQIGRWAGPDNTLGLNAGALASKVTIAFNGQTSTRAAAFKVPVHSLRTDGLSIFMLDANGKLVLFNAF